MTIEMTTLDNGLRVITDTVVGVDSVAVGAYFGVGTRNENLAHNGLAHLVEHMMFKGTTTRTAKDIAETIEGIGGHMNAYTSREVTGYHFHVLKDHVALTVEVLADMLCRSTFDPAELDRERGVIIQEIGMNNDQPDDVVFDLFQETAYPNQSLGTPILGREEVIAAMPRDAIVDYVRALYTPGNMVLSAAGAVSHTQMVDLARTQLSDMPAGAPAPLAPARYQGGNHRQTKDLEQAHVMLGFRGLPRLDPRYYDVVALSHILGGGMSSRLFQEIREKRGLVYAIYAFHSAYRDDGMFGVYAGTGEDKVAELSGVLIDELQKVQTTISIDEINRTKRQLKASLLMSRESMASRADQNAKHLLFHGRLLDTGVLREKIDAITPDRVMAVAQSLFATTPTVAALGPINGLPDKLGLAA